MLMNGNEGSICDSEGYANIVTEKGTIFVILNVLKGAYACDRKLLFIINDLLLAKLPELCYNA